MKTNGRVLDVMSTKLFSACQTQSQNHGPLTSRAIHRLGGRPIGLGAAGVTGNGGIELERTKR